MSLMLGVLVARIGKAVGMHARQLPRVRPEIFTTSAHFCPTNMLHKHEGSCLMHMLASVTLLALGDSSCGTWAQMTRVIIAGAADVVEELLHCDPIQRST